MRPGFVSLAGLFALVSALNASYVGVAVDGTCEAGSCPALPLPVNSTMTLPFDIQLTLPDGDMYLIYGSFTNGSNGLGSPAGLVKHLFQVTYEGNASGGPSANDTLTVEQFGTDQTTLGSVTLSRDVIGAFGSGIAVSSSISSL
jgi:hypothetical protein